MSDTKGTKSDPLGQQVPASVSPQGLVAKWRQHERDANRLKRLAVERGDGVDANAQFAREATYRQCSAELDAALQGQVPASVTPPTDHDDQAARVDGVPGSAAGGSTASTDKGVTVTTEKTNSTKGDPPPDSHELQCVVQVLDANGIETEMAPGVPYTVHGRVQAAIDRAEQPQSTTYQLAERIVRYFRDASVQAKVGHGHLIEGEVVAHVAEMLKGAQ